MGLVIMITSSHCIGGWDAEAFQQREAATVLAHAGRLLGAPTLFLHVFVLLALGQCNAGVDAKHLQAKTGESCPSNPTIRLRLRAAFPLRLFLEKSLMESHVKLLLWA